MLKFFILLALTTVIFIQTVPAYCGGSKTMTFQISVTVPPHVIETSSFPTTGQNRSNGALFSNNTNQLVQTQIVIRNNKSISLTSIVVP